MAILDLVIVASGFLLRAIGGAVVVDVVMSSWFLIVTGFGSLFVVAGKRLAELEEMGEEAATVRPTLDHYTVPFLRFVMGVACTGTAVAYCIFSFDKAEVAGRARSGSSSPPSPSSPRCSATHSPSRWARGPPRRTCSCGTACCSSWGSSGSSCSAWG